MTLHRLPLRSLALGLSLTQISQGETPHIPIKPQSAGGAEEIEEKHFKERARK